MAKGKCEPMKMKKEKATLRLTDKDVKGLKGKTVGDTCELMVKGKVTDEVKEKLHEICKKVIAKF